MAFGFQPPRCEVVILSDCIPADSVQYPLQNVSHLRAFSRSQRYLMCLTGRQDAETFRYQKMEALEGQNVTLPCILEGSSSLVVVMIEWSKSRRAENTKLALYIPYKGKLLSPNVTLVVDNTTMTSYLHLHRVTKWDSDIYTCSLSTFPLGSIRQETELKVTGKKTKLLRTQKLSIWKLLLIHVAPDCIRAPLLCQFYWLITSEALHKRCLYRPPCWLNFFLFPHRSTC